MKKHVQAPQGATPLTDQAGAKAGIRPGSRFAIGHKLPVGHQADKGALIVNLFGGPGVGKSTTAAEIFCLLKRAGVEAVAPEEHAKLAIWSGQPHLLDNQIVLLGRTWETLTALARQVDVIILDSPILLCSIYALRRESENFHNLCDELHRRHRRINILLQRNNRAEYTRNGRRESLDEARDVDAMIRARLERMGEETLKIDADDTQAIAAIAKSIIDGVKGVQS